MATLRRSNALRSPEMSMSTPMSIPMSIPMPMSRSILEHVHSYEDSSSQYNRDGTSSLLAALSFARIVFSMEQSGLRDTALLQAVMTRECAKEATAICALWSRSFHLDVEDIRLFEKTLKLKTSAYGFPGVFEFIPLLTVLSNLDSSAVAIITLHPETIACLKLQVATQSVFVIFDSRPSLFHTNGTGMIASTSIEDTASRLTELLRTAYFTNSFLHRQITNYSGHVTHVYVPHYDKASTLTLSQAALEPGFAQLSMQAEVYRSRLQKMSLRGEVDAQNRRQQRRTQRQEQWQLGSSSGPSKFFDQNSAPPRHFSSSTRRSSHPSSSITSISTANHFGPDFTSAGSSSIHAFPPIPPSSRDNELDSILLAMRLQHEFDNEDRTLSAQGEELAKSARQLFMCGICLEEMANDFIVRPDPCGHTFCRECLHEHVTTRLNERRFPILCPSCAASNGKGKGSAGEISQSLALDLGLNDEQYNIWTEMEMAAFAVILHCRKCQRTMFVERDEHDELDIITCPLPDCNHAWCKQCQQSVDLINDPEHSCDGTSELDHLMKQQGWKYCPRCKTPIQKTSGCNHMTCGTPGCNTDFCYGCGGFRGDPIVRPAFPQAIGAAQASNCQCVD